MKLNRILQTAICGVIALAAIASAQTKKPNILVIWGDDIGTWNISHNNRGMILIGNRFPALRGVGPGCEAGSGHFHGRMVPR